jgi:hypothetical protein
VFQQTAQRKLVEKESIPIIHSRAITAAISSESLTIVNTSREDVDNLDVTIEKAGGGCSFNDPFFYKRI